MSDPRDNFINPIYLPENQHEREKVPETPKYVMPPSLKKRWTAALRSEEYKQARSELMAADGSLCCLGVLAKICGHTIERDIDGCRVDGEHAEELLPAKIAAVHGLSFTDMQYFAGMNDDGSTFPEIANEIETFQFGSQLRK